MTRIPSGFRAESRTHSDRKDAGFPTKTSRTSRTSRTENGIRYQRHVQFHTPNGADFDA